MSGNYLSEDSITDDADFEAALEEALHQAEEEDLDVCGAWEVPSDGFPGRWEAQIYRILPDSGSQSED